MTCARVLDTLTAAINEYPPRRNQGVNPSSHARPLILAASRDVRAVRGRVPRARRPSRRSFATPINIGPHALAWPIVVDIPQGSSRLLRVSLAIAPHEHLPAVLACILIIVNPLHTAERERVPRMHPASFAQERASGMNDAFQDLGALMRLTASSTSSAAEPEAVTFLRRSLSQLGLQMADASVTQGHGERRAALDAQLAGVLRGLTRDPGVIALVEVWGGWNRRAASVRLLLSPLFAMLMACDSAPPPVDTPPSSRAPPTIHGPRDRRVHLPSGLRVLHTPPYAPPAFSACLTRLLAEQPKTITEIASDEKVRWGWRRSWW
ncbi:hypothetical protein B0H17DRAFT_1217651 [Mycena rosella]|uniref:Uncharacterized protein n=1 Tax=Mycena rosella TaxID=1033263 RepID=A0AAD7BVP4_MYCRO|nr:hypothetical protein B0H17DRAFT_1217651 [Mycena rosella]